MKRLLVIILSIFFGLSLQAQTKMTEKEDTKLSPTKTDGFLMKDGKVMHMKDGKSEPIEEDMKLKNDAMIMKDGTVKTKDGEIIKLNDGDWVMMDGTIRHKSTRKKEAEPKM